jgi:4-alpha-glucanotransferase
VNKRNIEKHFAENYRQTIEFRVQATNISNKFSLAITGNNDVLGQWKKPVKMHQIQFALWKIEINAEQIQIPFEFKFVLTDNEANEIVEWEEGTNRIFHADFSSLCEHKIHTVETSLGCQHQWRGAGTAIPVFSLRTENSCGTGEFSDLKLMIDWLKKTNQTLLQLLPVNDCSAFFDERDSCPYVAISMYALHPIYINVSAMGKMSLENQLKYEKIKHKLNNSTVVEYKKTVKAKWDFFKIMFNIYGDKCLESALYKDFINKNAFWLKPYSMFCVLRDKFKTSDFRQWKDYEDFKEIDLRKFEKQHEKSLQFHCFLQYHAHKQLSEVSKYARKNGVILKGDIPIGIGRNSVEAWTEPEYLNLETQAGAPPDDFSETGQNWKFPTYNWDAMRKNNYKWWIQRFRKISEYFDAYRIDHVLGFFRIWEIPFHSLQALLGHFSPALPYSEQELLQRGLKMNAQRYLKPHITNNLISEIFKKNADYVLNTFFEKTNNDTLKFKLQFDNQRKIETFFECADDEQTQTIKSGLFYLINNVLFIEDEKHKNHFYPRIAAQLSATYNDLNDTQKQIFNSIYDEFYYQRNIELWKSKALEKLPALISATNMLACCEDLGMIPDCVPDVIKHLQILSLEIQRMPKQQNTDFANPASYPYLSVCTTSTHDTSTLRGWWKENREKTQKFYNDFLMQHGDAPETCSGKIVEKILIEHLKSPSMFAVFPLQDWLAIDENLRRKNENEERINVPSSHIDCWKYRMHITIEQLLTENKLKEKIKELAARTKKKKKII